MGDRALTQYLYVRELSFRHFERSREISPFVLYQGSFFGNATL
ncbi:MAG: hypothetical protein ACR2OE_04375 [Thermomicrobiales bacterium]